MRPFDIRHSSRSATHKMQNFAFWDLPEGACCAVLSNRSLLPFIPRFVEDVYRDKSESPVNVSRLQTCDNQFSMAKVIPFLALADANLVIDAVYEGGTKGNTGDDPLGRL